jgi:hypothetical protein
MSLRLLAAAATATLAPTLLVPSLAASSAGPGTAEPPGTLLGSYRSGFFDEGGAEIVAHDPARQQVFAVNAAAGTVDVLSIVDPSEPTKVGELATPGANSVAVRGRVVAVAEQADVATEPGRVAFFDARSLEPTGEVTVGALPDMVTLTGNGRKAVTANEGEPEGYCAGQVDPRGSISVIDLTRGPGRATARTLDFSAYDGREEELRQEGIRIFGPGSSASQDLEPEYVATAGRWAWVTLQENNAVARVDLARGRITDLQPLGTKDHSVAGQGLDANDRDGVASVATRPVGGLFLPDGIATWKVKGESYLVTANEGDAREYDCFEEEARVKDLALDPAVFPDAAAVQQDAYLGRLTVTTTSPAGPDGYTGLQSLGGRSVTVWAADGELVWDSGDLLEEVTADLASYNADNAETDSFDSRSDNKGPEPEGVTVGRVGLRSYAFVGLERTSAVAVLDVSRPASPSYVGLLSNRDDTVDATDPGAGDLGSEGLHFVPRGDSPTKRPLLLVGNEVSGTTSVWELDLR